MKTFIAWHTLRNPIIELEDWSLKDACVLYREGLFHIFTSAFNEERSTVAHITTPDWHQFSRFQFHLTGQRLGAVGVCSPSILEVDGQYVLTFNTWGQGERNQLYAMTTRDFVYWSDIRPVAANLTQGRRCIDLALAHHGSHWIGVWREGANTTRFAASEALDGTWTWIGDGVGALRAQAGMSCVERKMRHENFQLLRIDGVPHLLCTNYDPHHPWLYRMVGDPDDLTSWTVWDDGYRLMIPSQRFNAIPSHLACVENRDFCRPLLTCWDNPEAVHIVDGLDNAGFLCDWRERDGFFTLLYAGKNEQRRNAFNGTAGQRAWPRGWNRLGLARSRDLKHWMPAGR